MVCLRAHDELTCHLVLPHVEELHKVAAGCRDELFIRVLPANGRDLVDDIEDLGLLLVILQTPHVQAVAADRGNDVGNAWVTLYLLHLHRAHRVHLTSQVVQFLFLKHLSRAEESLNLLEEYLSHCAKHHEFVVAGDMHTFDGRLDVVLHREVVIIIFANDVLHG